MQDLDVPGLGAYGIKESDIARIVPLAADSSSMQVSHTAIPHRWTCSVADPQPPLEPPASSARTSHGCSCSLLVMQGNPVKFTHAQLTQIMRDAL